MEIDKGKFAQFHLIVRGACEVYYEGLQHPLLLSPGDVILFPSGAAHWLADSAQSSRLPGRQIVDQLANHTNPFAGDTPKDASATVLICGHFELERAVNHPLLRALPDMVHIKNTDRQHADWMATTASMLIQESRNPTPGTNLIVQRLAEVLLVHVLRVYMAQHAPRDGFARALNDPQLSRAIDAIHNAPAFPWTLEQLARQAGMSRTAFAAYFKQLAGSTPMQYCLNWRMTLAHRYLRTTSWSLAYLAERVGYQSEAAFSRAFKRRFSVTPGFVRRNTHSK